MHAKIVVTGARGMLGASILSDLQQKGFRTTGVARDRNRPDARNAVFDGEWIRKVAPDGVIIHTAGLSNPRIQIPDNRQLVGKHVTPHFEMVERLADSGWHGRLIYISSGGAVYGEPQESYLSEDHRLFPTSPYGTSKSLTETGLAELSAKHRFELVVLRVSNPYGPGLTKQGQGVIPMLIDALRHDRDFHIFGDGSAIRDYLHITDFQRAIRIAASICLSERTVTVNIGSGIGHSLNEIIAMLEQISGRRLRTTYQEARPGVSRNVLNIDRARAVLGWTPEIELSDGLRDMFGMIMI